MDEKEIDQPKIIKRRRIKQTPSLEERLVENVGQFRQQAELLPHGHTRDQIMRRIRQNETASHLSEWLRSSGLRPPE
jgi:hypothetical protein